jgi:hypothetical protein
MEGISRRKYCSRTSRGDSPAEHGGPFVFMAQISFYPAVYGEKPLPEPRNTLNNMNDGHIDRMSHL